MSAILLTKNERRISSTFLFCKCFDSTYVIFGVMINIKQIQKKLKVGASMTTQTGSVLGSTASLQGQILTTAQGNAYVVQGITAAGTIDTDGNQLAHATRASPATVRNCTIYTMYAAKKSTGGDTPPVPTPSDGTITYLVPGNAVSAPQTAVGAESCSDQVEGAIGSGSQSNMAAHATRVSPATVQWLLDNYETAEGVSLPRRTLYQHYCRHCSDNKLEPVNAASFGKLIRSVFLGLRTRRLGTRGNSKYHYYGLRVKPDSPLVNISEDHGSSALRQQPLSPHKRLKVCTTRIEQNGSTQSLTTQQSTTSVEPTSPTSTQISQLHQIQSNPQQQHHQQFLGDASAAVPLLMNVDISNNTLPEGITVEDIKTFVELYRDHCESFLDVVTNLQFSMVEMLWKSFWRYQGNEDLIDDLERRMSKSLLYSLCRFDPIQDFVKKTDYQFYQNLVDVLIPDVLRPIPSSLTQSIRNFAKSLESWLTTSMAKCPDDILKVKLSAVGAFAQTLRRYTSLNHLAQAARAVLQNSSQIHQMLADLNRVDFHNVQEQASWVCQCDDITVQKLEEDFKATLQQQNSLEQWAAWLEGVVNQVLRPHEGKVDFSKAARQFLLKWSFYSSMVIRDLTLRSAASFGSFHLIRLLYDEYMFYLVEHRVAEATGETPIAVMGENIGLATRRDSPDLKDRMSFSSSNCGLSLVTNNSVSFSHQLCNDRSTDSESSTSSTGRDPESLELPLKRMKPTI
ncbi:MHC class II regulatory factor RFX1 [Nymphon striatum]|nr:MHC class II regulatory factor RFX1 [Nymphon striatum]